MEPRTKVTAATQITTSSPYFNPFPDMTIVLRQEGVVKENEMNGNAMKIFNDLLKDLLESVWSKLGPKQPPGLKE